ncbi:hypothetical protein KIN20_025966 [Parelaphostrongylus tenuis]|uniref:Uncharacterized protein n=1 Tax=Parelaphostrongylus tenuis TaxID=148309 RepID=A0AAD5N9V7_PARTN|nr:hypothetical protein KIN20_025966 [Parelaphostrongylus tenuis]
MGLPIGPPPPLPLRPSATPAQARYLTSSDPSYVNVTALTPQRTASSTVPVDYVSSSTIRDLI